MKALHCSCPLSLPLSSKHTLVPKKKKKKEISPGSVCVHEWSRACLRSSCPGIRWASPSRHEDSTAAVVRKRTLLPTLNTEHTHQGDLTYQHPGRGDATYNLRIYTSQRDVHTLAPHTMNASLPVFAPLIIGTCIHAHPQRLHFFFFPLTSEAD